MGEVAVELTDIPLTGNEVIASIGQSIDPDTEYKVVHYTVTAEDINGNVQVDAGHINQACHAGVVAYGTADIANDPENSVTGIYNKAVINCIEINAMLSAYSECANQLTGDKSQ